MSAAASSVLAPEAQEFLTAVERELADLPVEERTALLEDLAQHLVALAEDGDDAPVVIRLGSPASYAEDLRAAAGLPARGARRGPERVALLRERFGRYAAHPLAVEVLRLWAELRPAWWVLRGRRMPGRELGQHGPMIPVPRQRARDEQEGPPVGWTGRTHMAITAAKPQHSRKYPAKKLTTCAVLNRSKSTCPPPDMLMFEVLTSPSAYMLRPNSRAPIPSGWSPTSSPAVCCSS